MNVKAIDSKYVAGTYGRFQIEIVSGKGSIVKDENGKEGKTLMTVKVTVEEYEE